jgi:hypothetical protein
LLGTHSSAGMYDGETGRHREEEVSRGKPSHL